MVRASVWMLCSVLLSSVEYALFIHTYVHWEWRAVGKLIALKD